jgi:hypothetical protein
VALVDFIVVDLIVERSGSVAEFQGQKILPREKLHGCQRPVPVTKVDLVSRGWISSWQQRRLNVPREEGSCRPEKILTFLSRAITSGTVTNACDIVVVAPWVMVKSETSTRLTQWDLKSRSASGATYRVKSAYLSVQMFCGVRQSVSHQLNTGNH